MEEWVLPGGFHFIYNLNADNPLLSSSNYPMNQVTDMITNLGGAVIGMIVLFVWGLNDGAGIAIGIFSLFEAVIHVYLASKSLIAFGPYGQTAFYAPGLNTALFMFLPLFFAYVIHFSFRKKKPSWKAWVGAVTSLVGLSFLLVNLPEMLLKDENSPFAFSSHGYYDQFINGTYQTGLNGGTIGSIVIGSLLVVGIIGMCIYYFGFKKKTFKDLFARLREINN
jgi:divalent metal cation (Fe/Co/Zn/Cd) transporter